jgi:sugar lactone lactonase YvrE
MKRTLSFLLGVLLLVTTAVQAQFTYITNNGAITITGYIGGDAVVIPSTTNGYPITSIGSEAFYGSSLTSVTIPNSVTSIGQEAFIWCQSLTNITIPSSVTNIGVAPFMDCTSLTAITVAAQNPFYSSTNGVLFNNSQTTLLEYPGGSGGSYVIPAGVTNIGADAFFYCESLTSVTVPSSVTSIAENSFADCYTSLMAVYFEGNAPSADSTVFSYDYDLIAVYYLSGTTGWGATFAGVSAVEEAANYMVMVSTSPSAGGTVSGGGSFASFNLKTVTATANSGYTFANWTENGFVVSPADPYNFTLIGNRNLVANFTANPVIYTVIVSASPDADGTVGGGGTFVSGTSQTVTATANSGYTFANWTEGGNVVSSSASYTFTLGSNRNLVANYIASPFVLYVPSSFGFISTVTSADVVGTLVKYFGSPGALVVDQNGNLYAAAGNVYKFTPAGAMSTFASGFSEPTGLAFDGSGNLYVADFEYGTISKVTPAGVVSAFAAGFPSDPHLGGNGTLSLVCDGNGNVYLADYGSGIVWKITPAGVVSTFASGFCTTLSMASDAGGNLYLANFYGTVAKITPAGVVSTLASLSGYVTGLAFDGGGNLYASSTIAGAISRITTAGVVSTFASGFSGPIAIASAPTPPTVTTQPQNQGFINGQSVAAKFGIGASGQGISYQWQVSTNSGATWIPLTTSTNYNGVTTATLTVTGITPAISGCEYECVVTNALGSAISDPATLASVPFLMYVANQYNGNVAEATGTGVENLFTSGFSNPEGLALDGGGNLYVANQGNGTVSKVTPAGVATTIASGLSEPQGLAFDGSGNLYVANYGNGVVSEITPAGVVSIFASGFNEPTGLAFDGNGNLYVANYGNGKVSEVTPAGGVTPFASAFNNPISLAFDGGGNLYVADYGNGTIFEVAPGGGVSIIAGGFSNPRGLAFDGSGNLYVTEGLAVYGDGSFYVWDYGNGPVSEVTPAGVVTTYTPPISVLSAVAIATAPTPPIITIQPTNVTVPAGEAAIFSIDVGGAPGSNTFQWQISTDGGMTWTPLYNNATYSGVASPTLTVGGTTGNLSCQYECVVANTVGSATSNPATLTWLPFLMYVANYGNNTVSQVAPNGVVSPFAGGFSYPKALALDGNGNLYVANAGNNTISKVTPAGVVGVFASGITNATALAVDGSGNVYVACEGSGTILKVMPAGLAGVFAGGFANPTALALDRNGNLYVADYSADTVSKITPAGVASAFASGVLNPEGMAFDGSGNLYVTEVAGTVCKITPGGAVSAFASGFSDPQGMAFDGSGNLYVANYGNYTVSKVTPAGGVSAFVSGFNDPTGIAIMTAPAPLTTTNYTITVSASPGAGGTVSGGGAFAPGSSSWQTVIATVNSGYIFANWTENGNVVSWAPAYDVLLNSNVNLVANFIKISYQTLDEPLAASASGAGTYASGISGSNFVGYYTAPNGSTFGFLYNGGAWTTLDDPLAFGDTTPSGISGANIVGSYANDSFHGFLYSGGTYTTFSYFDGLYGNAHANGIDGAYVVGSFPDDSGTHGFLYNGSTYTTLDDPNSIPVYNNGYLQTGAYTVADGISRNTIVGSYAIPSFVGLGTSHGFLYANGSYTTLDVPNATGGTYVNGIDGSNIVGYYIDSAEKTHGFLYNGTNYTTLDDPNGVGSTYAFGISGNTIVGYYDDSNNVAHGFVATFPSNVYDTMLVSASPNGGGTVSGGGTFASGSTQTVTAAANSGYTFANWTENGIVMSSATNYSFTLNSNVTLVANFTVNPGYYAISVIASPGAGGMVSGGGAFVSGSSQTVTATASTGYTFTNWTENGSMVSSSPSYSFTLNSNVNLVAHFTVNPVTYTVTVSASPGAGGTVSGGGTFVLGSSQTVTATPNSGYLFVNWTQNGVLVSASPSYSFTLYGNLNLVANFKVNTVPPPTVVWIQPTTSSLAITAGTNVTFSVSAAGTGPFSYQWQLNGSNLPNGVITTVAGGGGNYPGNGGPATNTALYEPGSVTLDAAGNLFFVDEGNERICKVGTNGILTTVAGKGGYGYTGDGGPATNATLNYPDGLAVDAAGNLFFADSSNYRIRKVGTNGIITTVAGNGTQGYSGDGSAAANAELWGPTGVAADADGNVFFGDSYNNVIRKLGTNGIITTVVGNGYEAGTGYGGYTGDGGPAIDAELWGPSGVAVAPNGNLFFSDESNQRIREVGTNGIITTVAGGGGNYPGDGGAATNAQLDFPYDVTADASGNVFIADQFHQRVRKVDANGIISTVAGDGAAGYSGDGGAATNAELAEPLGVALDSNGDLFIGVEFNSRIREVVFSGPTLVLNDVGVSNAGAYDVVVSSPYGSVTSSVVNLTVTLPLQVTTVLLPNGTDGSSYSQQLSATNGHPPYSWSLLSGLLPSGLTLTTSGLISGAPTTDGTFNFTVEVTDASADAATQALALTVPSLPSVVIQPTNNPLLVAAGSNVTFYASVTGPGPFSYNWQLDGTNLPHGIGIITTVAGDGPTSPATGGYSGDGSAATNAGLNGPQGVRLDAAGNIFIADSGNHRVRKVGLNGIITTVAGNGIYGFSGDGQAATNAQLWQPYGVAVDAAGNLFVSDLLNTDVRKVGTNGIITTVAGNGSAGYSGDGGPATNAEMHWPEGIAVDASGNLFIADSGNQCIRKVGTNGIITTVAGDGTYGFSGDGGAAVNAQLDNPDAVTVDGSGNLFISDEGNQRIRKVGINGIITTVAGDGYAGDFGDGGPAIDAEFADPAGMAVDATGNLFIADIYDSRVREVGLSGIITTAAGAGGKRLFRRRRPSDQCRIVLSGGRGRGCRRQPVHCRLL